MKKLLAIITSGILLCSLPMPELSVQAEPLSGTCGENITYTLEGGVLTLTGTGATSDYMYEYDEAAFNAVWNIIWNSLQEEDNTEEEQPNDDWPEDFPDDCWINPEEYDPTNDEEPDDEEPDEEEARLQYESFLRSWEWWDEYDKELEDESQKDHQMRLTGSEYFRFTTAPWRSECMSIQTIRVGEGITELGDSLFAGCRAAAVELPASLTKIGDNAFYSCVNLEEISIPDSVTELGNNTFENCDSLRSVHLPASLTVIPESAFKECCYLPEISIPDSVTIIEYQAFSGCSRLASVHLPDSLETIGNAGFENCESIHEIRFPETLTKIGYSAFERCYRLRAANLPDSIPQHGLGSDVFKDCHRLETYHLPAGFDSIPDGIFSGCNIKELEIPPQIKRIGFNAFEGCPIRTLTIPDTVEMLGHCCFARTALESVDLANLDLADLDLADWNIGLAGGIFSGCCNLSSITLPKNMKTIPAQFLAQTGITEITIPASVESIEDYCFIDCNYLQSVTLPEGLKSIGQRAFDGCSRLKEIHLPDSLETIGDAAFMDTSLKEITFPPLLKELPDYAFSDTKLTEITIPERITALGENCFSNNRKLKKVACLNADLKLSDSCFSSCEALESVQLPSKCSKLPDGLLGGDFALKEIEIPESCQSIGKLCFYDCDGLESLTIPSSVQVIDEYAFSGCLKLKHVTFSEGLVSIGQHAFKGTALQEVVLPDSIEQLDAQCFFECPAETVTLPEKRIQIDCNALPQKWLEKQDGFVLVADHQLYRYYGSATDLQIPENVRVIQKNAFSEAHPVSITLNSSLQEVEQRAFNKELEVLTVPSAETKIHDFATTGSYQLKEIRGEYSSEAQILAIQNNIPFTPLHPDNENLDSPAAPQYGSGTLSFGNSGSVFGETFRLQPWRRAMLLDASESPLQTAKGLEEAWRGSCYGLSAVTVLVNCGMISPAELDPDAKTLYDVRPTENVLEIINYYQFMRPKDLGEERYSAASQLRRMCNILKAADAVNSGKPPFVICIETASGGAHAVVGYGLEAGSWEFDGVQYDRRVLLWDSNYYSRSDDRAAIYINREKLSLTLPAYGVKTGRNNGTQQGAITQIITDPQFINHVPYNSHSPLPGDTDCNNTVTAADAVLLARCLAEDTDITYLGEYNADLNRKGYLDYSDIIGIFRLIGTSAGKPGEAQS